jgi:hypothetical protein
MTGIHEWNEKQWRGTNRGESLRKPRPTMGCSTPEEVTAGNFWGLQDKEYQQVFFFTNRTNFTEYNTYIYITWQQFL